MRSLPLPALLLGIAAVALAAPRPAGAQDAFDIEGRYELVQPPQPTSVAAGKVEVVDVFWYGCPHCFNFLPHMEQWLEHKPDYVEVRRMPAVFRETWIVHAKIFYTAQALGVADRLHVPIFNEIHVNGNRLDSREAAMQFFARHGVDPQKASEAWDSFAVQSGVRRSAVMQERYGVPGTPTVIVNGKYRVTGSLAGSYENMTRVIEALCEREYQAMMAQGKGG